MQFYLTGLDSDTCQIGRTIRLHWEIENSLHWTLDVTFDEDQSLVRTGHTPQNLPLIRRIALNAINREQSYLKIMILQNPFVNSF